IEHLFPERHGFQARQRRFVQLRPGQRFRIELRKGLHEMAAEGVAMLRRSDFNHATFFFGPMNFKASRAMWGPKRGRFSRPANGARRRSFSAMQTAINSPTSISEPSCSAPLRVKLLSCCPLETSEAMPMRS